MTKKQHYMTQAERYKLEALIEARIPKAEIARILGFSRQTIYNELRRGCYEHRLTNLRTVRRYSASRGNDATMKQQHNKGSRPKLEEYPELRSLLIRLISGNGNKRKRYSPAAAIAEARRSGYMVPICTTTLYSYIYNGYLGLDIWHLWEKPFRREKRKKRKSKRVHLNLPSIEIRPEEINRREAYGHWEMDLVLGCHKSKSALLTLTERKSRQEIICKIPNRKSENVVKSLRKIQRGSIRSITTDNGVEFLRYEDLRSVVPEIYYCHSYAAWEKGSNENANRMIRRWWPKGTNFDKISGKKISEYLEWVNNYPRKSLGWKTPNEIAKEQPAAPEGLSAGRSFS